MHHQIITYKQSLMMDISSIEFLAETDKNGVFHGCGSRENYYKSVVDRNTNYRKLYLHFHSNYSHSTKKGFIRTLIDWAIRNTSDALRPQKQNETFWKMDTQIPKLTKQLGSAKIQEKIAHKNWNIAITEGLSWNRKETSGCCTTLDLILYQITQYVA